MRTLRDWSFARVLLVSGAWIVVCAVAAVAYGFSQFRALFDGSEGSGGIGAVSFGVNLLTLAVPLLPPIALIAAWCIARWSSAA